ncbi:MAG TPA: TetR/AcrR family transcriptional regulator C-terminal domain-containing protein [Cellulomonas sp.]
MARWTRATIVGEALDLLDEVGLDQVSTRLLAQRLSIKQPSLYSHFRNKDELLGAMAEAAMLPHLDFPLPVPADDWRAWFIGNTQSFRRTLLLRRDGARLHAGSRPVGTDLERSRAKVDYLVGAGLARRPAEMAMLAASRFTVGSVLEQQADQQASSADQRSSGADEVDPDDAFRTGLDLIVAGLAQHGDGSGLRADAGRGRAPAVGRPSAG